MTAERANMNTSTEKLLRRLSSRILATKTGTRREELTDAANVIGDLSGQRDALLAACKRIRRHVLVEDDESRQGLEEVDAAIARSEAGYD